MRGLVKVSVKAWVRGLGDRFGGRFGKRIIGRLCLRLGEWKNASRIHQECSKQASIILKQIQICYKTA